MLYVKSDVALNAHYTVSDLSGKVLKAGALEKSAIDISEFSSGLYLLHVKANNQEFISKFVKQ